jgi:predicted NAD/FAD-dependent oxidoreductase
MFWFQCEEINETSQEISLVTASSSFSRRHNSKSSMETLNSTLKI